MPAGGHGELQARPFCRAGGFSEALPASSGACAAGAMGGLGIFLVFFGGKGFVMLVFLEKLHGVQKVLRFA